MLTEKYRLGASLAEKLSSLILGMLELNPLNRAKPEQILFRSPFFRSPKAPIGDSQVNKSQHPNTETTSKVQHTNIESIFIAKSAYGLQELTPGKHASNIYGGSVPHHIAGRLSDSIRELESLQSDSSSDYSSDQDCKCLIQNSTQALANQQLHAR